MKSSSLQRNVFWVIGLYTVSLVAAMGCPASNAPVKPAEEAAPPFSATVPAAIPVEDAQPAVTAPVQGEEQAAVIEPQVIEPQVIEPPETKEISQAAVPVVAVEADPQTPPAIKPISRPAAVPDAPVEAPKTTTGLGPKPKLDPIKVNGEFFVGWPTPKLAILVSGRQEGYIEPCGCAGLENQKGGFARRHTLIEQLKEKGWPLLAVDVGNSVRRFGKQAELQFGISAEALKVMGYSAVGFGPNDLRLSAGEIAAVVAGGEPGKSLFVSANVGLFDLTPKYTIVEEGGLKVGITAVLGETYQKQVNNVEVEFKSAAKALSPVVDKLATCDVKILLANCTQEEAIELIERYPTFDFVVVADGGDEPPNVPRTIEGTKTKLIEVGHKGMFSVVLGLYDQPKSQLRYQRVALDSRYANSDEMLQLMGTYQGQLHDLGWEGLGLKAMAFPRAPADIEHSGEFAGSESCRDCHSQAFEVWEHSKHAHATDTLVKVDPPRHFDAECISCHATGWNPQEYFPYKTGYVGLEKTPHMKQNGCENCHGPAAAHVAVESGDQTATEEVQEILRTALRRKLQPNEGNKEGQVFGEVVKNCVQCHDLDNSPTFDFQKYWPEIQHSGMD